MSFPEAAEDLREQDRPDHGRDADTDRFMFSAQLLILCGESVHFGEDGVAAPQKALPVRRGDDCAGAPMEQGHAQFILQRLDRGGDGRL